MNMSINILSKLLEIDERVKKLENKETEAPSDDYPPFEIGKWYRNGEKVTFENEKYICIAPIGQVCSWSPMDYPDYWKKDIFVL